MKNFAVLSFAAALGLGSIVPAVHSPGARAQGTDHASHAGTEALADGEVRKVDRDAGKITIRHGALPALDMPSPMTMVYAVKEPALLDQVKAGDRIKFAAERVNGTYVVTFIEPAAK